MARSKSALVFLLLCIMVLLLSPWADAPSPASSVAVIPKGEALATQEPVVPREISHLTVEVALEEQEYNALVDQNADFMLDHPDILVQLLRVDPEIAYSKYKHSSEMEESADIMLLSNEWVKEFASSGYLLPADAAFVGKALAEQFDALAAPLKWNGYLWGVPRDMDPYVLVWNKDKLHEWLGEDAMLPLTVEQWTALAETSAQSQATVSWLTIDGNDPLALLAWLESAADERSDGLWDDESEPWSGTSFEQALSLLELQRANVNLVETDGEAVLALKSGTTLAAIVPYSEAAAVEAQPRLDPEPKLEVDHQSWKLPFIWPRANSFAISSNTEAEEAAYLWISEMTTDQIQLRNMEELGRLPVYRSLYDSDRKLSNLLPGRSGQTFPNQAPLNIGPELVARLERLGSLWEKLAAGAITIGEWKAEWADVNPQW